MNNQGINFLSRQLSNAIYDLICKLRAQIKNQNLNECVKVLLDLADLVETGLPITDGDSELLSQICYSMYTSELISSEKYKGEKKRIQDLFNLLIERKTNGKVIEKEYFLTNYDKFLRKVVFKKEARIFFSTSVSPIWSLIRNKEVFGRDCEIIDLRQFYYKKGVNRSSDNEVNIEKLHKYISECHAERIILSGSCHNFSELSNTFDIKYCLYYYMGCSLRGDLVPILSASIYSERSAFNYFNLLHKHYRIILCEL